MFKRNLINKFKVSVQLKNYRRRRRELDIVLPPPIGLAEDVEGLSDALELRFRFVLFHALEQVGMAAARKLEELGSDLLSGRRRRNGQHRVVVLCQDGTLVALAMGRLLNLDSMEALCRLSHRVWHVAIHAQQPEVSY